MKKMYEEVVDLLSKEREKEKEICIKHKFTWLVRLKTSCDCNPMVVSACTFSSHYIYKAIAEMNINAIIESHVQLNVLDFNLNY
jgi:hypothetical protein